LCWDDGIIEPFPGCERDGFLHRRKM